MGMVAFLVFLVVGLSVLRQEFEVALRHPQMTRTTNSCPLCRPPPVLSTGPMLRCRAV